MCNRRIGADCWEKPRDTIFTRYRLRRILRAMGFNRLSGWQWLYVFGRMTLDELPKAPGFGKTTACLVRLMMWYHGVIDRNEITCAEILGDPDYYAASRASRNYHLSRIEKAHAQCVARGIRVFKLKPTQRKRWRRP